MTDNLREIQEFVAEKCNLAIDAPNGFFFSKIKKFLVWGDVDFKDTSPVTLESVKFKAEKIKPLQQIIETDMPIFLRFDKNHPEKQLAIAKLLGYQPKSEKNE